MVTSFLFRAASSSKDLADLFLLVSSEHHQGFNSSIGTYHKIQSSIQNSQNGIRVLKTALTEAKAGLLTTKPELKGLATSSQAFDDMLQLLGQIEYIQGLPEKLEARISEKRFIAAVEILQEALRLIHRTELDIIGGLEDLRTYFSNQQTSLTDILVEELHDHLYLKSPYCQDRWKGSAGDEAKDPAKAAVPWERPVYRFLSALDPRTPLVDDASRNPEADTFYYIHLLIEALNRLGQLDIAVDRIEQRLPVELYAVVDKTSAEVDSRYPVHTRNLPGAMRKRDILSDVEDDRGFVLSEFLWNLYAKFEAIAEGHRVVHDVVTGIAEREGNRKPGSLTGGFKELWKLYQSEVWTPF
jgi:Xaa-Pro aminopeptidase